MKILHLFLLKLGDITDTHPSISVLHILFTIKYAIIFRPDTYISLASDELRDRVIGDSSKSLSER